MLITSKRLALLVALLCVAAPAAAQQPVQVVSETGAVVAGTPADAETNTEPFLARVGMRGYFFNGSTWDRMRGDTTSGLWVNVKNTTLAVTQSGSWTNTVTQPTGTNLHMVCDSGCSSSTAPADASTFTPSTTPQSPIGGFFQTTATNNALTNLQMGAWQFTAQRAGFVNLRNASGTEIGTSSTPVQVSLANTGANSNKLLVTPDSVALPANQSVNVSQMNGVTVTMGNGTAGTGVQRVAVASDNTPFETVPVATATTTDTTLTCYITSAASTNSTNCKASAGNVYAIHITNTTTTNYFVRMYNSSSAPTCSSSTGFTETIPALGASVNGGVNGRVVPNGEAYSTGIGFCVTGGGSSTDNTNAATGVYVTIKYK